MKITLFIGGLSGGGAERVTCNLANYLAEKKHEVEILTVSNEASTYLLTSRVTRYSLTSSFIPKSFLRTAVRVLRFSFYLLTNKRDVYIVFLPKTTFMLLNLRFLTKAKIIAGQRISPSSLKGSTQNKLKKYARKADAWTFQTQEQLDWFGNTCDSARTLVIPNAINPEFIKASYEGSRKPRIVTAGRMTKQKNQELLLRAFEKIKDNFPWVSIELYGEGPEHQTLQRVAEGMGMQNRIIFHGYTSELGERIKDASLFVLSSDYEGMPNALMEAMALGLPCISTDCEGGGARFLIKNEKNGLLVPKGDVDALAAAIDRMLSDREFAESCGREAHKICERLAPEKIYGEWEQFIKEVVEKQ